MGTKRSRGPISKPKTLRLSPYWRKLFAAKWVIVGITVATFLLSQSGMLDRFETAGLDAFNILKSPSDPEHVIIVAIDDDDYQSMFQSTSPLAGSKVQMILQAIAAARPRAIGVDIDTASSSFAHLVTPPDAPPIVWGRDAVWDGGKKQFSVSPVLGGNNPTRNMDAAAISQFPLDGDGLIRRYHRYFPVTGGGRAASFPWATVEAACAGEHRPAGCDSVDPVEEESSRGRVLNFAGQRFNFTPLSVGLVIQGAAQPEWTESSPLRNRIVLLGGVYRAARDVYVTPVGAMAGVQLMAQAIETELSGGGIRPVNEFTAVALDLVAGSLLVLISHLFAERLGKALLASLLALVVLPLVSSFAAFSTLARWFNFVPIIVGVLLHQLYEHGKEYQRLRQAHPAPEETHVRGGKRRGGT